MNDSEDGEDMEETEYDYFDESFYKRGKNKNVYYLAMRICIKEYNFQTPLSYYYIEMKDIPDKYEYDFKKYKII
jgi:uncharacterized protein YxeA